MTGLPKKPHAGNVGAPPGADPASLALARTQWAAAQLAKHLKIDLSDENQRNAVIARFRTAGSRASETSLWAKIAALYPVAKPKITPQYVQEALNAYRAIDTLPTNPD
ncbi:MAG: hypothetical protein A3F73_12875 [Gallionellales bacterium RIFCSPLOWO2_12_FULL_59_22]|nr:MAG: hypothetical protein A3H99_08100 [Gallionellales bacterium RIFCSPLOWO2_02_FULL_59_110]OGT01944.1 MAG: hypothetical protein A2Z65_12600 [Gallionellales bacterium RIFCSPLOWO2_02_58_13]OGT10967.1 MAG: hypothetical protein A3F73_12875 [Gallionellales bacterium RIFCSPLOWO2_12_FULL_59_22]